MAETEKVDIVKAQLWAPAVAEPVSNAANAPTPMDLLRIAMTKDADIDKLTKLMELQERWEAKEARKAFVGAMSKFKLNPPQIAKNKQVSYEGRGGSSTSYWHATLDNVVDAVTKGLSAVGISHSWKTEQEKDGLITVTCVLTHELGHSETIRLSGFPDDSGSKNKIQAVGSTVTYLQRYTLLAGTGLATKDDTDGRPSAQASQKPVVPTEKIEEYCRQMQEVETTADLMKVFAKAYNEAAELQDKKAQAHYIAVKDEAKKRVKK